MLQNGELKAGLVSLGWVRVGGRIRFGVRLNFGFSVKIRIILEFF